jgi:NADPH:quinone reductase-like Zn-dependent oxidoreductase
LKAVRYHSPGAPSVLELEDAPSPDFGPGDILLRVKACAVNRIDIWARSGRYKTTLPHILGTDVAGQVVAAGDEVRSVKVGEDGILFPVLSDGTCHQCKEGHPNLCTNRGFIGIATDGGYAELVRAPASNFIPSGAIDPTKAAAMPVDFGTAWSGLSRVNVREKDTVLVWGAAGGLGHAAVQIAKLMGARVIAVVGDQSKFSFVSSLGADEVLDHSKDDIVSRAKSLTGGEGVTVVVDHVGGDTWEKSIGCLARGGRMVTLGLTSGPKAEVDVRRVYSDELSIVGAYGQTSADISRVLKLASEGKLVPSIYRELPLASAVEAHETVESRSVMGKILLLP